MEKTGVQKLAGVLKVLVTITIGCNLLALFLVPGLALLKGFGPLLAPAPYEAALELPARSWMVFVMSWIWVWRSGAYDVVLTLFLLFCGCCTAVCPAHRTLTQSFKYGKASVNRLRREAKAAAAKE